MPRLPLMPFTTMAVLAAAMACGCAALPPAPTPAPVPEAAPAPLPEPEPQAPPVPAAPPAGSGSHVEPVGLGPQDAQRVPATWRSAFQRFLALKRPRALAVGGPGMAVMWSGNEAVATAMAYCTRRAGRDKCRVYAVDDTLLDDNLHIVLSTPAGPAAAP